MTKIRAEFIINMRRKYIKVRKGLEYGLMKMGNEESMTFTEKADIFFETALDAWICIYMAAILVILPFYSQEGYAHIGTDKSLFFRQCSFRMGIVAYILLFCYYVTKLSLNAAIKLLKDLSCTDKFVLLFGLAVVLSYLFTPYKSEALVGTDKWFMGTLPQLTFVSVYFFISRLWKHHTKFIAVILPVSLIVFALGFLNRFGMYPIDMKVINALFISTIGNINWFCGYMVTVFFGGIGLLWLLGKSSFDKIYLKIFLWLYAFIGFATLITQGSDSAAVSLLLVVLVMFCLSAKDADDMQAFAYIAFVCSIACLMVMILRKTGVLKIVCDEPFLSAELFTNSVIPIIMTLASLIFAGLIYFLRKKERYPAGIMGNIAKAFVCITVILFISFVIFIGVNTYTSGAFSDNEIFLFTPGWGSNRGTTWRAGLLCFAEQNLLHKLIGVGPDCMAAYIYGDGSEGLLALIKDCFGQLRLTNAHNEWITILVNEGLLGFIGFAGIMLSSAVRFLKNRKISVITGACGLCVLAYTANNMLSFQQSMNTPTMFVILGIGEAYLHQKNEDL